MIKPTSMQKISLSEYRKSKFQNHQHRTARQTSRLPQIRVKIPQSGVLPLHNLGKKYETVSDAS